MFDKECIGCKHSLLCAVDPPRLSHVATCQQCLTDQCRTHQGHLINICCARTAHLHTTSFNVCIVCEWLKGAETRRMAYTKLLFAFYKYRGADLRIRDDKQFEQLLIERMRKIRRSYRNARKRKYPLKRPRDVR